MSETTHALLPEYAWKATGGVEVKGKVRKCPGLLLSKKSWDHSSISGEDKMADMWHKGGSSVQVHAWMTTASDRKRA